MNRFLNEVKLLALIFLYSIACICRAENTSSFFIAAAKDDGISSMTQSLDVNTHEVSMLFDFGHKSEGPDAHFSIILSDHEKQYFVSIKFVKSEDGNTRVAIKSEGYASQYITLGKSKRVSVVLSKLNTSQLGINITGQTTEFKIIDLLFNVERLKFWLKGGELNMYYLLKR